MFLGIAHKVTTEVLMGGMVNFGAFTVTTFQNEKAVSATVRHAFLNGKVSLRVASKKIVPRLAVSP